ncbi:MAG: hypothetical protein J6Y47_08290 [Bacteroidales bacterium]|nr:hypothetical protein [Bacteroidales bacterium]
MKKFFILVSLLLVVHLSTAQKTWFVGGTTSIGYVDNFTFTFEPQFGYEFTDWFALGAGIGFGLTSNYNYTVILGVAEPFVRFCPWHNDRVFIDLKITGGFGFDRYLEFCQVGVGPCLRFRINEHWDMSADIGLLGAQYTSTGGWRPAFGISATSAGLWVAYRF